MAAAIQSTMNGILGKVGLVGDKTAGAPSKEPSAEDVKALQEKYEKGGQGHVFAFYDELSVPDKAALFDQLSGFDPYRINELADKALKQPNVEEKAEKDKVEPLPERATESLLDADEKQIDKWYKAGLEAISENKVAVVLMAGGQGTRLGSDQPKGCFNIGLPSEKSLLQLQGERIRKLQQLAEKEFGKSKVVIPWYVMTSGPTRPPTEAFFHEHNHFGLNKDDVVIFEQGVLPCISNEGKILMETKSKVIFPLNARSSANRVSRSLLLQMAMVVSTRLFWSLKLVQICENGG